MTTSDDSVTVWAAKRRLVPGQVIQDGDLREVRVRLAEASQQYLDEKQADPRHHLVQQHVAPGELVSRSAIGPVGKASTAPVVIELGRGQEFTARTGTRVQLWSARRHDDDFDKPQMRVEEAFVGRAVREGAAGKPLAVSTTAELFVPLDKVAETLEDVNAGARFALVPRAQNE